MSIAIEGGSFYLGDLPVDTSGWTRIGHTDLEGISFSGEVEESPLVETYPDLSEGFSFNLTHWNEDALSLFYGSAPPGPTHAVVIEYREPWLEPVHPRKGWPYVGKRYRQACRAWKRLHRRWKRARRPKVQKVEVYIPRATIEPTGPATYSVVADANR